METWRPQVKVGQVRCETRIVCLQPAQFQQQWRKDGKGRVLLESRFGRNNPARAHRFGGIVLALTICKIGEKAEVRQTEPNHLC